MTDGAMTSPPPTPSPTTSRRRLELAQALACLAGLAVSAELTRIHVLVHTDPTFHSVCAVSEGVNCETVAQSPFSVFAGLPVSVWGVLGYLVMGGLALTGVSRRRPHPGWAAGLQLGLTSFAVVTSAVLAAISALRIDSLCLFCMASYALNGLLLALALVRARSEHAPVWELLRRDLAALRQRPGATGALVAAGLVALTALELTVPAYWTTAGWHDLPQLARGTTSEGHHWIGGAGATVTVVEFSDYQCPHCRAAHKAMRLLAAQHPDRLRLVHRHLPLDHACHPDLDRPFHPYACRFAEAAECAGLQGRFWEMNDALFASQEATRAQDLDPERLAVQLGLDRVAFKRCLDAHTAAPAVRADVEEARRQGLTGTPAFLVGNQVFLGSVPPEALGALLEGNG